MSINWLSIDLIKGGSSEFIVELIVSINWLSIVSIDTFEGRSWEWELIVDHLTVDRYNRRRLFRVYWKVDCVDQLTVDCISRYHWRTLSHHLGQSVLGFLESKGWLCRSTDCRSYRSIQSKGLSRVNWIVHCVWRMASSLCLANLTILVNQHLGILRVRVDCSDQLTVDHFDRFSRRGSPGDSLLKSWLCMSTDCRSYWSIWSTGAHESKSWLCLWLSN